LTLEIACDGSCIQQGTFRKGDDTERPGAAGFVAKLPGGATVGKAEHTPDGLIGGMEVKALRMGLEFACRMLRLTPALRSEPIEIVCDSQYAVNGFNEWLKGWAEKGFHKNGGLANADEWRMIDTLKQELAGAVKVVWTKGHASHPLNNAVDQLVNNAARTQTSFDDTYRATPDEPHRTGADRLSPAFATSAG
jgi:ribonuclease HI